MSEPCLFGFCFQTKYDWIASLFPKISLPWIPDEMGRQLAEDAETVLPDQIYQDRVEDLRSAKKRLLIRFNTTPVKQIERNKPDVMRELEFNRTCVVPMKEKLIEILPTNFSLPFSAWLTRPTNISST